MALQNVKVISVNERPVVAPGGTLRRNVVVVIQTSFGNTGQLEIPQAEYEAMDDNMLAQRIMEKALMLDRAQLL